VSRSGCVLTALSSEAASAFGPFVARTSSSEVILFLKGKVATPFVSFS
jgi:hypothetical protein